MIEFLTGGEKVKKLREQLNLTQEELQTEKVARGLISMIETGRRDVSYNTALGLAEQFNEKARKSNIILNIDIGYLMRSPGEDAELYCFNKLKNNDITQSTIDEVLELSNKYNLLSVKAKTYFKIGRICSTSRNFEEACVNYEKSINIYKSINKKEKLGYIYQKMGACKSSILEFDAAIVYYGLSQHYSYIYDDKETQKLCLYSLANAYKKSNQIDLALETIEKYLSATNEGDAYYNYAKNIEANCYETKGNYDKAIAIYKSLLEKFSDEKNIFIGYVYNNLGLNYSHKAEFENSIKYFEMAENIIIKIDKSLLSHTLIEKSMVFFKQSLKVDAIKTVELGLKYASEYNDIEYLIKGNYILAGIYDKSSDAKNSERIYLTIIELLKTIKEKNRLVYVYVDLALMYLKQGKLILCEKYLLLSKKLKYKE